MRTRIATFMISASVAAVLGGCGGDAKTYDISPLFPLDPGKCARYQGDQQGTGLYAPCMVTKDECEKAAADWRTAMQSGNVSDAIEFSCR